MSKVNDAVDTIIRHKANKMKGSSGLTKHIKSILKEYGIISSEDNKETVNNFIKVFKMGAVDAMIYDVGAALDFTKQKKKRFVDDDDVDDWTHHQNRKKMIRKIFPKR